jgi:hypothetical protein
MFAARLICSWIGAFGLAAGAFGQTYVQIDFEHYTNINCMNRSDAVAGTYSTAFDGPVFGFVRDAAGTITRFNPPGSMRTTLLSINAAGAVTGYYSLRYPLRPLTMDSCASRQVTLFCLTCLVPLARFLKASTPVVR